jgi:hypothetical protein
LVRIFISYQVGDASITSKPINAPRVVITEENQEPNIEPTIVRNEKNMIHQFLWVYNNDFSLSLKNLGSFKCHEISD